MSLVHFAAPVTDPEGIVAERLRVEPASLKDRFVQRDKVSPCWGNGLPLLLLIILGSVPGLREPMEGSGGLT